MNYGSGATKTGLGSSACVTVGVVGGILKCLLGKVDKKEVDCVSQMANMEAQSKIGSNFDISAAVYGSHLYTNALPRRAHQALPTLDFASVLQVEPQTASLSHSTWLLHTRAYLLDLSRGSNTRTMVSGFLQRLQQLPQELLNFNTLSRHYVLAIHGLLAQEDPSLQELRTVNTEYRSVLQRYSQLTGVPV